MSLPCDEALVPRLPLPLAQLYRRAHNAHRAKDRKETAYCLWEAAIKLLGSVCVCEYAQLEVHDPRIDAALQNLARPALGHWVGFVRTLLPVLRDHKVSGFDALHDALTRRRDDLPRVAGLDSWLRHALEGKPAQKTTVHLLDLFARLTQFRNQEIGHGAIGARDEEFYAQAGLHLLAAAGDFLTRVDLLAGRRLYYLQDLRKDGGLWISARLELLGESPRRVRPLTWPAERGAPPVPQAVYLDTRPATDDPGHLCSLNPLVVYDEDQDHLLFLNSQRGSKKTEYLCYHTGEHPQRPDLGGEHRALLRRVLNLPALDEDQMKVWAERLALEESPDAAAPAAEEKHRRIGEFELLAEIGRGGQSIVYRALQPSLQREVALKRLLVAGNPNTERHFQREIRALARVDHPNLIKIYTSGIDNEQWFYAMELIDGADLGEISARLTTASAASTDLDLDDWHATLRVACAEARQAEKALSSESRSPSPRPGSLPDLSLPDAPPALRDRLAGQGYVRRIVELLRQVALATHALHQAGVIHRDIKPSNVMVDQRGERAVLMDLGLAKITDASSVSLSASIGRGFVGTLRYASPEQALPQMNVPVDARSDVYSLGATLWELLTLKPLFGTAGGNDPSLLRKIQQDDPPLLRSVNKAIPADLEAIVARCLEKDPAKRYPSAAELAADLQRYLNGETVSVRPVGGVTRWWRYLRRRPLESALAAVCVLGVLALGGIFVQRAIYEETRRREAEVRQIEDEANAKAIARITEVNAISIAGLKRLVGLLEGDRYKRDPDVQPFREGMLASLRELTTKLKDAEELDAGSQAELADLFLKLGGLSRVVEATSNGKPGAGHPNSREQARLAFDEAVALYRLLPDQKAGLVEALLERGELNIDELRWQGAADDLAEAAKLLAGMAQPLGGKLLDLRGEVHHQRGRAAHNQGRYAEALGHYDAAVADRKALVAAWGAASPEKKQYAENNLARAYGYKGDTEVRLLAWKEARASYADSEKLRTALAGADKTNPEYRFQLARSHGNTANWARENYAATRLDGLAEAVAAYRRAGELQAELMANHRAVVDYRSDAINNELNLARVRLFRLLVGPGDAGERAEVGKHLDEAEKLLGRDDGGQLRPFRRARSMAALLRAYLVQAGDSTRALDLLNQAERFYLPEEGKEPGEAKALDNTELYDQALLEALRGAIERGHGRTPQADQADAKALLYLEKAFAAGWRNAAWADAEPAFQGVRGRREVEWKRITDKAR